MPTSLLSQALDRGITALDTHEVLPPLNMTLARYLVIQAIKSGKIRSRSAMNLLDIAGLSQLLLQVSNLVVDCPEIQRLDIHPLLAGLYAAGCHPNAGTVSWR